LAKETGRPYRLLFMVSPVEEVTSDSVEGEAPWRMFEKDIPR
jgi:hypothetical protein